MTLKNDILVVPVQGTEPITVAGAPQNATPSKVWWWLRTEGGYVTGGALLALIQLAEHPSIARVLPWLCGGSARLLYRAYAGQAEVDQTKSATLLHVALAIMAAGPQAGDKKAHRPHKLREGQDTVELAALLAVAENQASGPLEVMDTALCGTMSEPLLMSNYAELLAGVLNELPARLPPAGVKRVLELIEQAFMRDPTQGGTLRRKEGK